MSYPEVFNSTDVWVTSQNITRRYTRDGEIKASGLVVSNNIGMCFDDEGFLYIAGWENEIIHKVTPNLEPVATIPTMTTSAVESVIYDPYSGTLLAGHANGTEDIVRFTKDGQVVATHPAQGSPRGSDWLALHPQNPDIILYGSEGRTVMAVDTSTDTQLQPFVTNVGEHIGYKYANSVVYGVATTKANVFVALDATVESGASYQALLVYDANGSYVTHVRMDPDMNTCFALAVSYDEKSIWMLDYNTSASVNSIGVFEVDWQAGTYERRFTVAGTTTGYGIVTPRKYAYLGIAGQETLSPIFV